MTVQVNAIMIGVRDLDRAKKFFLTHSSETVDETIRKAVDAGGSVVKEAAAARWGGYFGYFSDPDGYLWKVASSS